MTGGILACAAMLLISGGGTDSVSIAVEKRVLRRICKSSIDQLPAVVKGILRKARASIIAGNGNDRCASESLQILEHFQSTGLSTARKRAWASLVTPLLISFSGKLEWSRKRSRRRFKGAGTP
jgi:hypothetical protein